MSTLDLENVSKSFAGFRALKSVDLHVTSGERRAVIGPNGAGKTTLFNVIAGQTQPTRGRVRIDGKEITGQPPHRIWERGLTRTFQRNQLFLGLTVHENVRLAAMRAHNIGRRMFARMGRLAGLEEEVLSTLHGVNLLNRRAALVRDLAYGEQRQLELALALIARPKILLLDEPTAGMSPAETDAMIAMLAALPPSMTLLIVEHDMDVVFALAGRITVLHLGEVLAEGTRHDIETDPKVISVYFGQEAGAAA
jgi:branched-chain amino acid transport system ATP-binding protein